jgi:hypothetical protein
MKSLNMIFAFMLTLGILGSYAQQTSQVTVYFPKDFCQNFNSPRVSTLKIDLQISGLTDQAMDQFNNKVTKSDGVIDFIVSGNSDKGIRIVKAEFFPQADFDYIKNLLIENSISFVNDEDVIFPVSEWKPFTNDQCTKISQLNKNITDMEMKFNVIKESTSMSTTAKNEWIQKNSSTLSNVKEMKRTYLESIK